MNKWMLPLAAFVLLIITVAIVYWVLKPPPGKLVIRTVPIGVQVSLDGRVVGTTTDTGLVVVIEKTRHRFLELSRHGYETDTSTVWAVTDQMLVLDVVMHPPEMVWIRGGEFVMGWDGGAYNEKPEHKVNLAPYYIDRTEVPTSAFRVFKADYRPAFSGADLPATNISWQEAQAYCQSVGKRLPTEAEWERACRGAQGYAYEYGMSYDTQKARTGMGLEAGPVGVHTLGERGLVGLTGNVWEWCADGYDRDIYRKRLQDSFETPVKGDQHVLRGGAWYNNAQAARCTHRPGNVKKMRDPSFGFRCARDSE